MTDGKIDIPDGVRDAAIDWWLRHNEGPLSKEERADFATWLSEDQRHAAAFEKISGIGGLLATQLPGARPRRNSRRRLKKAATAISLGAIALFFFLDDIALYLRADYFTGVGESKRVVLDDGSHVELNAKSAIAVHYAADHRSVVLLAGEAFFEATPDPSRPFVVEASGGTVTALGTAFDVAVEGRSAHVAVAQHRVAVASGGREVIVSEGQQSAYAARSTPQPAVPADIDLATSWRRGRLIFENRPLGDVVEALGRYHQGYVYIANAALRSRRVSGVFRIDDPLAALDEIESSLGLHTTYLSKYLIIIRE